MASNRTHKKLRIGGMTCVNCQHKIERKLRNTAGIARASVDYNAGTADISYDTDIISLRDIVNVIEQLDYEVLPEQKRGGADIGRAACMLVIILCLYILLQRSGILNRLAPSRLADTKMGYGMLFVIGLITSVHCVAMCGGISLSQCVPRRPADDGRGGADAVMPAVLYNLGRVISYTVIGFLLGLLGRFLGGGTEIGLSALLQGLLKLIAGAFMVIMGLNMLDLFPWMRVLTLRPPKFLTVKIGAKKAQSRRPLVVGLLNGLMPCGPLQSMQIVALASGNPFAGALSMLLFSLGTVPLMLGLGSLVSVLGKRFTRSMMCIGAVLVVVLGLAMLAQGGSLSGLLQPDQLLALAVALSILAMAGSIPFSKRIYRCVSLAAAACLACFVLAAWGGRPAAEADAPGQPLLVDGVQVVNSTLSSGQYPNITVQAGTPVRWIIDAPAGSVNGCNYKMILQEYGVEYTFQEGENVIEFTPAQAGTYQYSCWMGMIHGNIFVVEADGTASAAQAEADPSETLAGDGPGASCCG